MLKILKDLVHCCALMKVHTQFRFILHTLHQSSLLLEARSWVSMFQIWTWRPNHLDCWLLHSLICINLMKSLTKRFSSVSIHVTNCYRLESTEKACLLQTSPVQVSCYSTNTRIFDIIATINRGLQTYLNDFKSKSMLRWRKTVIELTFVPFSRKAASILGKEQAGDRVVRRFFERPLLPMSLNVP